jgi:hypothetical protein
MISTHHRRRQGRHWQPPWQGAGSACHGGSSGEQRHGGALTGGNPQIANWPGLTAELLRGGMPPDRSGHGYQLVDLPGIHDLSGSSVSCGTPRPICCWWC